MLLTISRAERTSQISGTNIVFATNTFDSIVQNTVQMNWKLLKSAAITKNKGQNRCGLQSILSTSSQLYHFRLFCVMIQKCPGNWWSILEFRPDKRIPRNDLRSGPIVFLAFWDPGPISKVITSPVITSGDRCQEESFRKMKECTLRAYWELLIVTQNRG